MVFGIEEFNCYYGGGGINYPYIGNGSSFEDFGGLGVSYMQFWHIILWWS